MAELLGVIDAQYILRRNFSSIQNLPDFGYQRLFTLLIQSIVKLSNERGYTRIACLFDKAPYKRAEALESVYKADRHYASEADRIEITEDMTLEQRLEAEAKNHALDVELERNKIMQQVKYSFINSMGRFGFHSLIYKGYEADDLAYYIANKMNVAIPIEFATIDSDWTYLLGETTSFHRLHRNPVDYNFSQAQVNELGECELAHKMKLIDQGVLRDLYYGSHNGTDKIDLPSNLTIKEFFQRHLDGTLNEVLSEEQFKEYQFRYNAMCADSYFGDEIKNYITEKLNEPTETISKSTWDSFAMDKGLSIYYSYYRKFADTQLKLDCPVGAVKITDISELFPL